MDELHRHRSFTNTGGHPFYGTMAHIAHGKDAWNIGFEQEGIPVERPSPRALPVTHKVRTSQQETALVPLDNICEPIGPRQCSNENKHRARWHTLNLVGIRAKHRNLFQMCFAMRLGYAGMRPQLDIRRLLNLVDQVS